VVHEETEPLAYELQYLIFRMVKGGIEKWERITQ
jgi:hypothetical protein